MTNLTPVYQHVSGQVHFGELTNTMHSESWELMGYVVAPEAVERLERLLGGAG